MLVSAIEEDHRFLGRVFSQQGWMLHKTRSLESAMDLLRCDPVPVVMTERDLPLGNWKDVLAAIQQLPQVPMLIVTARLADEYLWAEVLNLGGYDVLSQPFQVTELLWVFGNAWRMRKDTWTRERCSPGNNESLICRSLKQKGKPKMNAKAETTAAENETVDVAIMETEAVFDNCPSPEDIAVLAYSYWEARGFQGGSPEEDWLRAEQEMRSRRRQPED